MRNAVNTFAGLCAPGRRKWIVPQALFADDLIQM